MDWIEKIQKAIEYIENEIYEKSLSSELVAKQVYISNVHFTRAFNVLTGLTVAEYIRNRRLTIAGQLLKQENKSIINVAFDMGYETPEAFSKAFKRFHGVNPSESKTAKLKEFYPLKIKITLTQEKPLSYRIEEKQKFYLNGNTRWVSSDDEFATANLWKVCEASGYLDSCYNFKDFQGLIGVYNSEGYTIKAMCNNPVGEDYIALPQHNWAVFLCEGDMPETINETWNKIYSEWMSKNDFMVSELPQLEVYKETEVGYCCEIWIGIKQ